MIQWIDLRHGWVEMEMLSKDKMIIVVVALLCMTGLVALALYLGIDGAVYGSAIGIFGIIIGAVAKSIYEKKG